VPQLSDSVYKAITNADIAAAHLPSEKEGGTIDAASPKTAQMFTCCGSKNSRRLDVLNHSTVNAAECTNTTVMSDIVSNS